MRVTQLIPVAAAGGLVAILLFQTPQPAFAGDSKEYTALVSLQRDFYDLSQAVGLLKSGEETKSGEMITLLKQIADANARVTADLKAMQEKITAGQTEQQQKIAGPISDLNRKVDDLSGSVTGVQTALNTMGKQQGSIGDQLDSLGRAINDIRKSIKDLPPPAPPSVSQAPSPDETARQAFAAARTDRVAGKAEDALKEFIAIATMYPTSVYAAESWMEIGNIYARSDHSADAINAYNQVLERLGDSPARVEAQFRKAEQLAKSGQVEDAVREYQNFAQQNPDDDLADVAKLRASALKPAPTPAKAPAAKAPAPKGRRSR